MNNAKKSGGVLQLRFKEEFKCSNNFARRSVMEKIAETNLLRYGVKNCSELESVKDKKRQTFMNRFGVDNPLKNATIKDRVVKTNIERYGVKCAFTLAHRRGTAKCSFSDENVRRIALERRITNNKIFVSKMELKFLERLRRLFKEVDHQVRVSKWPIDFYIKSLKLYVQFDGAHHHGINICSRKYEKVIAQMKRDSAQNDWFAQSDLRLLRISSNVVDKIDDEILVNFFKNMSSNVSIVHSLC